MAKKADVEKILEAVKRKYAKVSRTAKGQFNYPTGKTGALRLGYDSALVESLPDELIGSFCGVGNPFTLGRIKPGETVLDVGCGAGLDLIVASRLVGPSGKVCGIDLTPEMIKKAKKNLKGFAASPYEVKLSGSESIPYEDAIFDVVISNGVLNLTPFKQESFREISRVLKPKGRFQFADIVLKEGVAAPHDQSLEAWSS